MAENTAGKTTIAIDPLTRVEGHLKAEVVVENGKVVDAHLSGGMFRGFEQILRGRDPRDASQIVQRICGVCPTSHATASSMALDDAFGITPPTNGRITRNLILGANYLQSHILHFYHLAALDFVSGPDTAPFVPRYAKPDLRLDSALNAAGVDQYIEALEVRRICHEMVALFGGRMPHVHGILAGGASEIPTKEAILEYAARLKKVRTFIEEKYVPVVYTVGAKYADLTTFAQGHRNCLCVGAFPLDDENKSQVFKAGLYIKGKDSAFNPREVTEYVKYSWFDDSTTDRHYTKGENVLNLDKPDAYSFVKAPAIGNNPVEVGPLARMWITNPAFSPIGKKLLKENFNLNVTNFRDLTEDIAFSVLGRHIARAEETYYMLNFIESWLKEVKVGEPTYTPFEIPTTAQGTGFVEAPRGSLIHFVDIKNSVIDNYQIVSATLWNARPRDDFDVRGPMEEALIGTPVDDISSPVNVGRVIRAFDP